MVIINPKILTEEDENVMEEGCLSIPEIRANVTRAKNCFRISRFKIK